jgi:Peptidase family M1 domain
MMLKKSFQRTLFAAVLLASAFAAPRAQTRPGAEPPDAPPERTRYVIRLKLDFDARAYEGRETVRWVNRGDRPSSVLYFHLYPNLRPAAERNAEAGEPAAPDEPRLEVTAVSTTAEPPRPLVFALEDGGVSLRVQLSEAVAPGAAAEVGIDFKGSVPEISSDETSLPAHVIQQVGAALRDTREVRRARDTNFFSRGVMLLGSFYPVLAVREGGEWQRRVEPTVGDQLFAEPADYTLTVEGVPRGLSVFSAAARHDPKTEHAPVRVLEGRALRHLPVIAGRNLRSESRTVEGVPVRSIYTAEHEKTGRRVLEVASEATRVFTRRFGPLPEGHHVAVAEAPLVAGHGSTEFSGLAVIASAFYVDFDSPAVRNLPEIVREQRASVEESLEFAVAQGVAHQWWGAAVGNDPEREPFLDEALAHWSALLYVRDAHGEERARVALEDQLRGVYQIYRTFGGEDMPAERPAREYRNSFQYAAVVTGKGALMFVALQQLLGEERFFRALRSYYEANRFEVAQLGDLRAAFVAEAELLQRRMVTRTFNRWLSERRGDEDVAPPNPQLAAALGVTAEQPEARDRNAFSRLGRFFWRQMTRIR